MFFTMVMVALLPFLSEARERTCCRYSCEKGSVFCSDHCTSSSSCVLRSRSGSLVSQDWGDAQCVVARDSKKDGGSKGAKEQDEITCQAEQFVSSEGFSGDMLPFRVLAYPFSESSKSKFVGIDIRFSQELVQRARFRLLNKACEGPGSLCHPRCVHIEQTAMPSSGQSGERTAAAPSGGQSGFELSYDCEAGFLIDGNVWRSTAGDDYEVAVCEGREGGERCGVFRFQLPALEALHRGDLGLVLLETGDSVVAHVPVSPGAVRLDLQLVVTRDNRSSQVVKEVQVEVWDSVPYGQSQVQVTPLDSNGRLLGGTLYSSFIRRPEPGSRVVVVLLVALSVVTVSILLALYRRWQAVSESAAVEPRQLLASGEIQPRSLLVITTLDNSQHVEVVRGLCRYWRDWCGVTITYFALDDEHGIGGGDPWKWCQETGDSVRQNGSIVFIAGPDRNISRKTSIHPNLEQNQAFLTTSHLQTMAAEGRVFVVKLPYSHMATLPQEVPDHLKLAAYSLPRQMNDLLVRLLQLPRRALCRLAPLLLVRPIVLPANLSREGGKELLAKVEKLTQASLVVPEMVVGLEEAESLLHSGGGGGEAESLLHSGGGCGGGGEAESLLHSGGGCGGEAESLLQSGGEAESLLQSGGEAESLLHTESSTTQREEEEFLPHTQPEDHSTTLRIELEANLPSTKDMSDRDPLETED